MSCLSHVFVQHAASKTLQKTIGIGRFKLLARYLHSKLNNKSKNILSGMSFYDNKTNHFVKVKKCTRTISHAPELYVRKKNHIQP